MEAETFLDNFAARTDAAGGVQQLRDLVLDLALRGRLSSRSEADGAVDDLLHDVVKDLHEAAARGELRKPPSTKSVSVPPHSIPPTWRWEPLARLVAILDFRRQPVKESERLRRTAGKPSDELYPYFGATQQAGVIDDYLFDEELVLLGEDGAPFFTAGKHVAYVVTGRYWVNNHAHVLRGLAVANRYLVHALNRADYAGFVTGTTRLKLTQARMAHLPVPVPPLAEQERIIVKVDELMRLCDRLEDALAVRSRAQVAAATALARAVLDGSPTVQAAP